MRYRERPTFCPGGMVSRLTRAVTLGVLLPVVLQFGCVSHAERKANAEHRWNQVRARMKYDLASQQFDRGRADTALETVSEAIAADPTSPDLHLLLAHCYLEQGKLVSAREAAEEAKRLAPESAEAEYTLGVIAEHAERMETALEHYRRARQQDERNADYVVAEAECLAAMGRLVEAVELVSANLQRFDSDGTLETLLAQVSLLSGDKEAALQGFGAAIERSGCRIERSLSSAACATLIEEYGRLLSEVGRHTEAVALLYPYVEARRDAPTSVITALCSSYLETARVSDAKRLLREEVDRSPDNATSWMLLARAFMMTNDWMTARQCVDRLVRLVPDRSEAQLMRGFVCWKQDDLQAAIDSLQRASELEPQDAFTYCLLGRVMEDTGRPGSVAAALYERALRIDPQLAWARSLQESLEVRSGRRSMETHETGYPVQAADDGEQTP